MIGAVAALHAWSSVTFAVATRVDVLVFAVAAALILSGAIGVVVARNPVHAALMLIMTLLGVAVAFVEEQANFLAAVQVIVYAGAIVVLFLFVIMFLGVDKQENLAEEPLPAQRLLAVALVALGLAGLLLLGVAAHWSVGAHSVAGAAQGQQGGDVAALGRSVFTTYLFPFEATAALLVIAVVGAVVLVRRPSQARPSRADATGPEGETPPEAPSGTVGDPMVALAEAVANAVAAGIVDQLEGDLGKQSQGQPAGEGGRR